jgi:AmmeMemoRadiSam system protein A
MNYEAPFGVGYLVAQMINRREESTGEESTGEELPHLARTAVETFIRKSEVIQPPSGTRGILSARAPCFVSLKTLDGELRGCIGTIEASRETLAQEIIANAISAAINDPRFVPVSEDELSNLRYSVDVLLPAEETVIEQLDPRVFGVIVEDENGGRRGLLLPDIPGVDNAEQQVEIAARKAGIPAGTPVRLWLFKVDRFREANPD